MKSSLASLDSERSKTEFVMSAVSTICDSIECHVTQFAPIQSIIVR